MRYFRPLLVAMFTALFAVAILGTAQAEVPTSGTGAPGPVKAPHLTVELIADKSAISAGDHFEAGLHFILEKGWHVYWVNAGDSGDPPSIKWDALPGLTAGPMQFPAPRRLPLGPLMDFGYEDSVVFPMLMAWEPPAAEAHAMLGKPLMLAANVNWLMCREVCIPGKAAVKLPVLTVNRTSAPNVQSAALIAQALASLPKPLAAVDKVRVSPSADGFDITLTLGHRETAAEFYPFDADQIAYAAPQAVTPLNTGLRVHVKRADAVTTAPTHLHGLVKLANGTTYEINPPITAGAAALNAPPPPSIATAVGLAFVGGIILNLMPCVFPVLFLKGLALVHSSQEERGRVRAHGLVYTLGILISFWTIVGVLLALRASGSQFGWGFQLQSPGFLAVLASLLFFLALSLAGMFDVGLSLTSAGGSLAQKSGYTGSFFTGVLATVVATPCTAPFMGVAIGFALAQPPGVTFLIFTAIALGLALPYLALTLQPAWVNILPKPGAWMEVLKQLTAVPIFATVIWLVWVYGRLYSGGSAGVDAIFRLLIGFLVLAIAGWVLGRWPGKLSSAVMAVLIVAIALAIPLGRRANPDALVWQSYSAEKLTELRATGKPVFIDFTAAWCLSCQVNERLVLNSAEVQQRFRDGHVQLLRADWTQYDAGITQELATLGRSGVPTYVIYPAGAESQPDVLPEALTKSIVLNALAKDAH